MTFGSGSYTGSGNSAVNPKIYFEIVKPTTTQIESEGIVKRRQELEKALLSPFFS